MAREAQKKKKKAVAKGPMPERRGQTIRRQLTEDERRLFAEYHRFHPHGDRNWGR